MLDIIAEHVAHRGRLTAKAEGEPVGHLDFAPLPDGRLDLYSTHVYPAFEGHGYGRELVAAGVAFARSEGLRLAASCPYAAKVLDRNPDWSDVWQKS